MNNTDIANLLANLPVGVLKAAELRSKATAVGLSPAGIGFTGNGRGVFTLNARARQIEQLYETRRAAPRPAEVRAKPAEAPQPKQRGVGRFFHLPRGASRGR